MVWVSDPVTNALIFSVHTDADYFPRKQPPPEPGPLEVKILAVKKTDLGSDWLLHVSFIVPDVPDFPVNLVTVHGMQMVGTQRLHDKNYPSMRGNWTRNEQLEFSVRVPKECSDAAQGWDLTFCVGSAASCYPGANLLKLMTDTGKTTP
jgi:hypothetical protein